MRLGFTDEQRLLDDAVRRVLADVYPWQPRAAETALDDKAWAIFAELGLLGIGLPPAFGGSDGGADEIAIVAGAFGEALVREPFIETIVECARAIEELGTATQCEQLLPEITAGRLRVALVRNGASLQVADEANAIRLTGAVPLVQAGGWADLFLVAVQTPDGTSAIYLVPRDTDGLEIAPVPTVDGRLAADLRFDVQLPSDARLGDGGCAGDVLERTGDAAAAAAVAAAAGSVAALARLTIEYVKTREQFGQPIGSFQTVQHRVARMAVLVEEARAAALFASVELRADRPRRQRAISSAITRIAAIGDHVAREAVQLHGAIGMTEELQVGGHVKALFAFARLHGGAAFHAARLAKRLRSDGVAALALAAPFDAADDGTGMTLALSREDEDFRQQLSAFFNANLDEASRRGGRLTVGIFADPDVVGPWHKTLHRQGWIAPYLPEEVGGTGWNELQGYLFESEYARAGAPPLQLQGLRMLAPVLLHYGTPEQREYYLPHIFSGTHRWCQGYSEPGAGSDLAALRTAAVSDGDDYIINGSKIWTTQAQHATHMFALVRTSTAGRRQDGISFLLIDMATPGISVRPIRTLPGDEEVNEVFFSDVRVPKENRIGAENEGWVCAKYLLEFERGGSTVSGGLRAYFANALEFVRDGALDDRIAAIGAEIDAIEMMELCAIARPGEGMDEGLGASARKLRMAEIRQRIGALAADALGTDALRWASARPLHHQPPLDPAEERRIAAVPLAFNDLAYSIFAGSSEVQLSILARGIGLPFSR